MRDIRVDITGTTDASGNFSQTIRLDKTDEWRVVKVAIGTTGPAEWALTTSGTPLTYGRGRRVTLGPELLKPFDTLVVSCTGGPVNATVSGSCGGMGGDEQEIIRAFVPAPNTIALDVAQPRRQLWPDNTALAAQTGPSFVAPTTITTNKNFTLPTGTTDVRIGAVVHGGLTTLFAYGVFLVGVQSGIRYFPKAGTGTPFGPRQPITIPVDVEYDTQVQVQLSGDTTNSLDIYVSALFAIEAVEVYSQEPIPVTLGPNAVGGSIPIPPPGWQAISHVTGVNTASCGSGSPGTVRTLLYEVVFSVAANAIRVFNGRVWDGVSGGTLIGAVTIGSPANAVAPITVSATLRRLVSSAGNALTFDFDFAGQAGEQQTITASGDFVQ